MDISVSWILDKFKCSSDVAEKALQGYQNYLKWEETNNMKIVSVEDEMVSEKYLYGGCLDCIFEKDGVLSIGDFKTSNAIYQDYLIQIAAYKNLWEECHPDRPITGGFHLLRFSKEHADFAHYFWGELDDAWRQFILFREAYDIDKLLRKRV